MYQYPNYLAHHGVKGMKWGVRRARKSSSVKASSKGSTSTKKTTSKKIKTGLKVAAGVGLTVAAAYGAHKLGDWMISQETKHARALGESYAKGLLSEPSVKTASLNTAQIETMALKSPNIRKALHM